MDNQKPMMQCGHAANAKDADGNSVCVICILSLSPDDKARLVAEKPDLNGRQAACVYRYGKGRTHGIIDSSTDLAFFEHRPDEQYDKYYCGCHGWD